MTEDQLEIKTIGGHPLVIPHASYTGDERLEVAAIMQKEFKERLLDRFSIFYRLFSHDKTPIPFDRDNYDFPTSLHSYAENGSFDIGLLIPHDKVRNYVNDEKSWVFTIMHIRPNPDKYGQIPDIDMNLCSRAMMNAFEVPTSGDPFAIMTMTFGNVEELNLKKEFTDLTYGWKLQDLRMKVAAAIGFLSLDKMQKSVIANSGEDNAS